ncbi:MAG: hypothetical protein ACF8Q5_05940 [Phycisphaerales bacterium JB040]
MRHANQSTITTLGLLATLAVTAGFSRAQDAPAPTRDTAGEHELRLDADPRLRLTFTPYFWAPSMTGDVTVLGVKSEVDVDFGDLFSNADALYGFMGVLDASYDRLIVQFNGAYAHVAEDNVGASVGPVSASSDVNSNMTWIELAGGYRFLDRPLGDAQTPRSLRLDGLAGVRYTSMDVSADTTATTTVTLPNGTVLTSNVERSLDEQRDWFEPFVGARAAVDLSERWTMSLRGDVGGFGVDGSDFSWQTVAAFGYGFDLGEARARLVLGYRALGQDYSDGDFGWEVVSHGPLFGLQFNF